MNSKSIAILIVAILVIGGAGAYLVLSGDESEMEDELDLDVQLTVFGNANGDFKVDGKDVDELKNLIDKGEKGIQVTDAKGDLHYLADANGDNQVTDADIDFVKKIIDGKAEKITILDGYKHYVTAPVNPEKVVSEYYLNAEILQLMGAQKKIVATDAATIKLGDFYLQGTDMDKIVNMGGTGKPDYEKVEEITPDLWLTYRDSFDDKSKRTTATVVGLNLNDVKMSNIYESGVVNGTLLAGYIFNNLDAAEKYVKWVVDLWTTLNDVSSNMDEKDKPVVLYGSYGGYIEDNKQDTVPVFVEKNSIAQALKLAGGHNLADDFKMPETGSASNIVSLETILTSDFDYLFVHCIKFTGGGTERPNVPMHGYTTDDPKEWNDKHVEISKMLAFEKLGVDNIYLSAGDFMNNASGCLLTAVLVATAINPELFPGLDMMEVHQQYIDILGFDYDLSKHGVFYKTI